MLRLKNLSNEFIESLIQLSSGRIQSKTLDDFISLIEKEINRHYFTSSSESNLVRIIKSQYDFTFFINESSRYPNHIEIVVTIASNSNYLSDILVINPEYFSWIVNPSTLKLTLGSTGLTNQLNSSLKHYKSLDTKVHALKNLKRKEILRIGLKDIYNKAELNEVVEDLSVLAGAIASKLFELCYEETLNKYSIKKINRNYCLVGLGKLGGNELNYSSDIDLMIFYDKESKFSAKYYSEILIEAIKLFNGKMGPDESGILYRVDFRLRPDGIYSPLCRSITEYLNYYESRGEDWERQMLIKAKLIGGSKSLYYEFINYITPFIFPSSHNFSPMEQIQKMKNNIERNLTDEENIKLISGGIRDIEFPVQALQLLNSGKNKKLRTGNTLTALNELKNSGLLSEKESGTLVSSYILYRRIEHYLQLMNDRQTHIVPQTGELADKLSHYLGFKSIEQFQKQLRLHRKNVRQIYDSIVDSNDVQLGIVSNYSRINFKDENRAKSNLLYLREGKGLIGQKKFDKKSIAAFLNLESVLISHLQNSHSPDKLLDNFTRIIKSAAFPSIWYEEFIDDKFYTSFLTVCELSQLSVDLYAEDKELRESFLSREVFDEPDIKILFQQKLKKTLFQLSVQITLKLINPIDASEILSEVVREKIKQVVEKYSSDKSWKKNFFVSVLGSTGSGEMTFSSDVDLIFVVENITKYPNVEKDFQNLLNLIKNELQPFQVDCRLRPEGKSSQLVWDFQNYSEYYRKRARIWELQSLLKINFIAGNKTLFESLMNSVTERIKSEDSKRIISEMRDLRKKNTPDISPELKQIDLKKSNGGLIDVENIIHCIMLLNSRLIKPAYGKSFIKSIELIESKLISVSDLEKLKECYYFLKQIIILNQVFFNAGGSKISTDAEHILPIAEFFNYKRADELRKQIVVCMKTNRELFNKYLK